MSVFRVEKTGDYTVMSNYHLRDHTISLKAKGLLSVMLSLPEDWDYTMLGLARISKEGVCSIQTAIDELELAGYVVHGRVRNAKGQLKGTEYIIYEHPVKPDDQEPKGDNPVLGDGADNPFTLKDTPAPEPIAENPVQASPIMAEPMQAAPSEDEPPQGNRAQLNINLPITQKQNTYSASTDSFFPSERKEWKELDADEIETQRQRLREQIDYDYICTATNRKQIDELIENMLEVMFTLDDQIRIGKQTYPTAYVQSRFRRITGDNILHVLDGFDDNSTFVRYAKGYLLTSLFNSTSTMDNDYTMKVRHDFYGR